MLKTNKVHTNNIDSKSIQSDNFCEARQKTVSSSKTLKDIAHLEKNDELQNSKNGVDMSGVFYIDFLDKNPIISEYEKKYLNDDLTESKAVDPLELDEPDWRVFKNPKHAHEFLARYLHILNHDLDNEKICVSRDLPCMLYKRRYIVQSMMGVKLNTFRSYEKLWKPGTLINLNDQTYFLTVEILKIRKVSSDEWRYDFRLAKYNA